MMDGPVSVPGSYPYSMYATNIDTEKPYGAQWTMVIVSSPLWRSGVSLMGNYINQSLTSTQKYRCVKCSPGSVSIYHLK